MNAFDSTLSLCMRARRLVYGFETVKAAVLEGRVALLLTAADLSPKTRKEVGYLGAQHCIPHLCLTAAIDGMAHIIGRKTGVIGITDKGFADRLMLTYNETEDTLCR